MSIESDASSQIINVYTRGLELGAEVGIKIGGEILKLSGRALKELLKFIVKCIQQDGKNGRILLTNMLTRASKEGKTLSVIRINDEGDFNKLAAELKSHGVTFAKARGKDCFDILVFEEDAPRINIILEKLGILNVEKVADTQVEQPDMNGKEDPFADGSYYEYEVPFDDDNIEEYDKDNVEDFFKNYFYGEEHNEVKNDEAVKDSVNKRGDKETKVPTREQERPVKEKSQSETKSENERRSNGKESVRDKINKKKAEKAERSADTASKAVDIPQKADIGAKTK